MDSIGTFKKNVGNVFLIIVTVVTLRDTVDSNRVEEAPSWESFMD